MNSFNLDDGWWKWGVPDKRKSLADYPKFKSVLENLWNTNLDAMSISTQRHIIVGEKSITYCYKQTCR